MDLPNQCEQKKNEVKYDPGWNDPPTFSYNAQLAPGAKPRLALNKRVAFPLQATNTNPATNSQIPPINQSIPPTIPNMQPDAMLIQYSDNTTTHFNPAIVPTCPIIPPVFSHLEGSSTPDTISGDICDSSEVVDILQSILDQNAELGNKIVDIKRRINVMETMWKDGKLDKSIQISMLKLSKALQNSDTETADEVHKALMVDHISSVGSWMVAIKQLIFHCTAKKELLDIDKE